MFGGNSGKLGEFRAKIAGNGAIDDALKGRNTILQAQRLARLTIVYVINLHCEPLESYQRGCVSDLFPRDSQ